MAGSMTEPTTDPADDPPTLDQALRLGVYRSFVDHGAAPTAHGLAAQLEVEVDQVSAGLERLHEAHVLVLDDESRQVRMAMPFSSVPTAFLVHVAEGSVWANCIWDALGIGALMQRDIVVETACGDCADPLRLEVTDGQPDLASALLHFAVPARHWWDDIVFT